MEGKVAFSMKICNVFLSAFSFTPSYGVHGDLQIFKFFLWAKFAPNSMEVLYILYIYLNILPCGLEFCI